MSSFLITVVPLLHSFCLFSVSIVLHVFTLLGRIVIVIEFYGLDTITFVAHFKPAGELGENKAESEVLIENRRRSKFGKFDGDESD